MRNCADNLRNSTFILAIHDPEKADNMQLIGTTFSLSPRYFLGAFHCLKKWDRKHQLVALNPSKNEEVFLTLVDSQEERDLVVFEGHDLRPDYLEIENEKTDPEERIYIFGFPPESVQNVNQYKGTLLEAAITGIGELSEVQSLGSIIIFDKVILGNHSGSPIVNESGKVLGIAKAEIDDVKEYENHSLGIYLAPNDVFISKYI